MADAATLSRLIKFGPWLRRHKLMVLSFIGWLLLVALDYWTLWPILSRPANKDTAPAIAAAITVNGALLTAAVAYAGLLFKNSADNRAAEFADQANRRAELEEQRLHMEAAMKAVSLLAADGRTAPQYQTSALLIVLAELGQLGLAVDLAAELWPANAITRTCGVELIDRCITSQDPELLIVGMRLLAANAPALVFKTILSDPDGTRVEQVVQSWPRSLSRINDHPSYPSIADLLKQAKTAAEYAVRSIDTDRSTARAPQIAGSRPTRKSRNPR